MYIDSHAHVSGEELFPLWPALWQRAQAADIEAVVNICTDLLSLERGVSLHQECSRLFLAAATPPHTVEKEGELFFPHVEKLAREGTLVAIGETGLDYYYEHSSKEKQKAELSRYFRLAKETKLPLIFHCRDAFADLFSFAQEEYPEGAALVHCFTGTKEEAKKALERGWMLSFSGILTFKKSTDLQEVARYVPLDRILIETDAPYLAPQSKRGKTNEPSFLIETAKMLAALKDLSLEKVAWQTTQNARLFFSF